jgi:hypothetical protein
VETEMSWTYVARSGAIMDPYGRVIAIGYSGHGAGRNVPEDHAKNEGPIPVGRYRIDAPVDTERHGPYVLGLEPDPSNDMHGRDGFLIHGDSHSHPGEASLGCIVLQRQIREAIWDSGDHDLDVLAD